MSLDLAPGSPGAASGLHSAIAVAVEAMSTAQQQVAQLAQMQQLLEMQVEQQVAAMRQLAEKQGMWSTPPEIN